jgi:hypothetical protein
MSSTLLNNQCSKEWNTQATILWPLKQLLSPKNDRNKREQETAPKRQKHKFTILYTQIRTIIFPSSKAVSTQLKDKYKNRGLQ